MSAPEPKRWWRRPYDLDLVWAVLPCALVAIGFGVQPLKSWDYWWHIAFGRMVAATGEMPTQAHWLYTMSADAPAYVQPWIAQLTLYELHDTFGLHAVLLLRNVLAALAFGLLGLWAGRRAGSQMLGAVLALVASAFGFFTIAARSHLLAWPLFLLVMPLAYGLRAGRVPRAALVAFPAITALWANLHGTFPVTPVVCAAFAAAEFVDWWRDRAREPRGPTFVMWAGACAASLVATLLNPRGIEVWGYLWMLSTNRELRETVSEWWPTTLASPEFYGAFFWVLLAGSLALMWRHRARLDFADFFMLLWIALLTIPQARFMLWFALALPVAVSPYVRGLVARPVEAEPPSGSAQLLNVSVAAILVLTALAVQPWGGSHAIAAQVQAAPARLDAPNLGLVQAETPYEPVALIKQRFAEPPRMFHDHRYPGFLLYELDAKPLQQLVFVDNRIELLPYEDWRRFDRIGAGDGWQAELDALEVDAIVTAYQTHPGLIAAVKQAPAWECPYDDDVYVLCWRKRPLRTPTR